VGVSSEPEISTHEITKNDRFLILASDGIWEFISNEVRRCSLKQVETRAESAVVSKIIPSAISSGQTLRSGL
jgi:serine/threonine protein phosphatase PrpC